MLPRLSTVQKFVNFIVFLCCFLFQPNGRNGAEAKPKYLLSFVPSNLDRGMVNKLTGKTGKMVMVVVPFNPSQVIKMTPYQKSI